MSVRGVFQAGQHRLQINADDHDNDITISRDQGGHLLANGGAIHISPDTASVDNTDVIRVNGGDGNDVIRLDESNGPLPAAQLLGGDGNDTLTGASSNVAMPKRPTRYANGVMSSSASCTSGNVTP